MQMKCHDTGLENHHIRALRNADNLAFAYESGESCIRAIQDKKQSTDGFEKTVVVPADSRITIFRDGKGRTLQSAFLYVGASRFSNRIHTMWRLLVPGDVITLEWVADNNTIMLRSRDLHRDELHLHIYHKTPSGQIKHYSFLVAVRIAPHTNRMVALT
jgi:hypothetical protein